MLSCPLSCPYLNQRADQGDLCMTHEHEPQMRTVAAPPRRTLEDKLLKFIEGHNPQIWTAMAVLAAVVVLGR